MYRYNYHVRLLLFKRNLYVKILEKFYGGVPWFLFFSKHYAFRTDGRVIHWNECYSDFSDFYFIFFMNVKCLQFRPPIALRTACRVSDAWREKMKCQWLYSSCCHDLDTSGREFVINGSAEMILLNVFNSIMDRVGLVVSVSASREFVSWSGHTKDHKNGTSCLPAWHAMR